MLSKLTLQDVHVQYPLLSPLDYNLKRTLLKGLSFKNSHGRSIRALNGISISLAEGDRLAIIGENGSGKTTLLKVMAGVLPPFKGQVFLRGKVLSLLGGAEAGLQAEESGLSNILTMGVQLGESAKSMKALTDEIVDFSGLGSSINNPVFSYSSGMAARLRFSILTSLRPDVLLLDEGIGAADAAFAKKAQERLNQFMQSAGILVVASHSERTLLDFCNKGIYLHNGEAVYQGKVADALRVYSQSISKPDSSF